MTVPPHLELYLIRHGQTDMNASGHLQGNRDIPLSAVGWLQARLTAVHLATRLKNVDAVYTSALSRAHQTAEAIAAAFEVPVQRDAALNEMDVGNLEGMTWEEARARFPETIEMWYDNPRQVRFPGAGEAIADFVARVGGSLDGIRERHPVGTVLIVSHGGALNVCMAKMLKMGLGDLFPFHFSNCGVTRLHLRGDVVRVQSFNEVCHLSVLREAPRSVKR